MNKKTKIIIIIGFVLTGLLFSVGFVFQIDPSLCAGCQHCQDVCMYGAVYFDYMTFSYQIDPDLCQACGDCYAVCGHNAIYQTATSLEENELEKESIMLKAHPNPAFDFVNISYNIPVDISNTDISVFNVKGQLVKTLRAGTGNGSVRWDLTDTKGIKVSEGVYFYNIEHQGESKFNKIIVLK